MHSVLERAGRVVVLVSFATLLLLRLLRGALGLSERQFYEAHPVGFAVTCVMGVSFILGLLVLLPLALVLKSRAGAPASDVAALRQSVAMPGSRHWLSQLVAATLVGAVLPLAFFWELRDAPGSIAAWIGGCAAAGLVAGLFLLSPARFCATLLLALGLTITLVPMYQDGVPVTNARDLGVKAAIGLLMAGLGVFLLRRSVKEGLLDPPPAELGPAADERGLR